MYMQNDIIFVEKCECECKKVEKMSYPPFPLQYTYVTQDSSPKIFCWTSWLHQKFPLVILALLLCFLPSLFLLVAPLSLL